MSHYLKWHKDSASAGVWHLWATDVVFDDHGVPVRDGEGNLTYDEKEPPSDAPICGVTLETTDEVFGASVTLDDMCEICRDAHLEDLGG